MKTQKIAAIDIGSNSIKLAIIEAAASDSFTIIAREREAIRLGQETLKSKILSADAISRAAVTIERFRSIAENRNADQIIAVATATVREAENSHEFVAEVERLSGVRVEVLSAIEEARLIGIAASHDVSRNQGTLLNIDIGGGSTELSLMENGEPDYLYSMKLGAVGLTERFISTNPPNSNEMKALHAEIQSAVDRPRRELEGKTWRISSGTSGTIITIAGNLNFENSTNRLEISRKRLSEFNRLIGRLKAEDRAKLPNISLQRAEIIVAGGQILEGVMSALKIETLQVSESALREGVVIDFLRKTETESMPPMPDVEDINLRGVFAVGRRFGYEETHALQVSFLAERIFDEISLLFNFKRHHRTLLSAAALLHDIGFHIAHESHHKHSQYLIKHSELTGFSESERLIIANVARYHRGSLPRDKHFYFMSLTETDRHLVWQLGAILRLADALDRSYASNVRDLKFRRNKDILTLELASETACEKELQAAELKKEMFETAFNCKLKFIRKS